MATAETLPARAPHPAAGGRPGVAVQFALGGDLRYLGHLDELRLLMRALTRAGWPLAYSQGFNPQPRVRLPLPRRVMIASECEWALVELTAPAPARELHTRLEPALPAGCRLRRVISLPQRVRPHARRACYQVALEPGDAAAAAPRIAGLRATASVVVERRGGPQRPGRTIDIRPFIESVTLVGRTLTMWLAFEDQRSARPEEILETLHLPTAAYNHCICRAAVEWDIALDGKEQWPQRMERNTVGQEENDHTQTEAHIAPEKDRSDG